jgi:outer membrane receptor protein involved in Fe transport
MKGLNVRFAVDNLTDVDYTFTQGGAPTPQRLFNMGRTFTLTFGYNFF